MTTIANDKNINRRIESIKKSLSRGQQGNGYGQAAGKLVDFMDNGGFSHELYRDKFYFTEACHSVTQLSPDQSADAYEILVCLMLSKYNRGDNIDLSGLEQLHESLQSCSGALEELGNFTNNPLANVLENNGGQYNKCHELAEKLRHGALPKDIKTNKTNKDNEKVGKGKFQKAANIVKNMICKNKKEISGSEPKKFTVAGVGGKYDGEKPHGGKAHQ